MAQPGPGYGMVMTPTTNTIDADDSDGDPVARGRSPAGCGSCSRPPCPGPLAFTVGASRLPGLQPDEAIRN